ncbi:MAG: hypothetical protein AB1758_29065, partial [Candidatus Eremiobacterota bacterium]
MVTSGNVTVTPGTVAGDEALKRLAEEARKETRKPTAAELKHAAEKRLAEEKAEKAEKGERPRAREHRRGEFRRGGERGERLRHLREGSPEEFNQYLQEYQEDCQLLREAGSVQLPSDRIQGAHLEVSGLDPGALAFRPDPSDLKERQDLVQFLDTEGARRQRTSQQLSLTRSECLEAIGQARGVLCNLDPLDDIDEFERLESLITILEKSLAQCADQEARVASEGARIQRQQAEVASRQGSAEAEVRQWNQNMAAAAPFDSP